MARDGVQELRERVGLEAAGAVLDQPQAEVNVAEETPLRRLGERRGAPELEGPAYVVHDRGREQQIRTQARMELAELPADRGDADGVLQEATRVVVMRS